MRKLSLSRALLPLLLGVITGCASPLVVGQLDDRGFVHARHDYRVAFADTDGHELMPDGWVLDNFASHEGAGLGAPKRGEIYEDRVALDVDGDGRVDTRHRINRYDLLFLHRETGATMFVRTLVVSPILGDRALWVLVRDYVDGLAGTTGDSVALERPMTPARERRLAAQVVREGPLQVGELSAYTAIIDLVNLDQRELTSEAVWERSEVVVVRPGFHQDVKGTAFPVLLVAGYVSRPEDFASHQADFHDLLSRLAIGGRGAGDAAGAAPAAEGAPPAYGDPGTPPPGAPSATESSHEGSGTTGDGSEAAPAEGAAGTDP